MGGGGDGVPLEVIAAHADLVAHEFTAKLKIFSPSLEMVPRAADHRAPQDRLEFVLQLVERVEALGVFQPLADIENGGGEFAGLFRRDPRNLGVDAGKYRADDAERSGGEIHHVAVAVHERFGVVIHVFGSARMRDDEGIFVGVCRLDLGGEAVVELALDDGFASKIEPAATDKDAFIVAHPGAAEYINDDIKSFMERYSDMMYLGAAALSIIGSIFAGIYTKVTRVAPEKASQLATAILDIGERMEYAKSLDALDELQDELEAILRGAVIGLRDGTISSDGLDTFKLGYEFVRDEIGMRREHLKRHPSVRRTTRWWP